MATGAANSGRTQRDRSRRRQRNRYDDDDDEVFANPREPARLPDFSETLVNETLLPGRRDPGYDRQRPAREGRDDVGRSERRQRHEERRPRDDEGRSDRHPRDDAGRSDRRPRDDAGRSDRRPRDDAGRSDRRPRDDAGRSERRRHDDTQPTDYDPPRVHAATKPRRLHAEPDFDSNLSSTPPFPVDDLFAGDRSRTPPFPVDNPAFSATPRDMSPAERSRRHDDYPATTPPKDGKRLYRKAEFQTQPSVGSSVDLEMVEMRPKPGAGVGGSGRRVQKYEKGPSAVAVPRRFVSREGNIERASAYSTFSVKSWSEVKEDISVVTDDLNKHFKPIFDKHGVEGVPIKKLEEELLSKDLAGRESMLAALMGADRDHDDYLSYEEFVQMVMDDLKSQQKIAFRGMLLDAISHVGILPKGARDDFLQEFTFCPPPLFIPIITLIQIIIFAVYVSDMKNNHDLTTTAESGYPYYSPLHYIPQKRWQAWRFLTYMFIHNGYYHIISNMISQVLFAFPLELVHGWWRTAIIYITGVTAGSLAHSVTDSKVALVGASGGAYAILGAHLAAVITNWVEMNYKLCDQEEFDKNPGCSIGRIFASAPARLVIILLLVVPETGLAIYRRATDDQFSVGVTAHIGGFLTGLFVGIRVLKNVNQHTWEGILGWVTVSVFLILCAFSIFFNTFFNERYGTTDWSWSYTYQPRALLWR